MGFYNKLEQIDAAVNRGYARWRKWIWGSLLTAVLLYSGWIVWSAIWGPPSGPVTLIIHSEIDRPILGFSVNGVGGSNAFAFAYGGGGATCCGTINGKNAEVVWILSTTRTQYNAGLRKEIRHLVMPLPERKWDENDLHVHFLPNDKVLLGWSDNAWSPYEKRPDASKMVKGK
ncbi:DUF3304 domain-containing protein [Type-D symbiont of Plautia stali]|uniref:DUF3304 domain-containing protein n=1 Tax=Type-D symbiont of Plautia stali TaxID=1560356 RepID=UPI00092E7A2F|nr:DUF3304 domain-containing protein [Type-D symbiont of Plautia stali]